MVPSRILENLLSLVLAKINFYDHSPNLVLAKIKNIIHLPKLLLAAKIKRIAGLPKLKKYFESTFHRNWFSQKKVPLR